jgi:ribonuclease T2
MLLNRFVLPILALVTASAMAVPADAREFIPEPVPSTPIERPILRRDRPVRPDRPTERPTLNPDRPTQTFPGKVNNVPGQFDYYVMALSWSPDYCATKGGNDSQQCGGAKKLGFVLHGLWPQYNRGYPQSCSSEQLSSDLKRQFPNLYPSTKLYDHEWEKHGTCSGLGAKGYLQLSQQLKDALVIPDRYQQPAKPFRATIADIRREFTRANPAVKADGLAATCSGAGRFLQEITVCYSKDGKPGSCSPEVIKKSAQSCGQADFLVRSVR